MNVLFAGRWDLAGAYIANRFLREGHTACWVTRESRRTLWHPKLKGSVYRGEQTTEALTSILRSNRIDTVVFLTGNLRESLPDAPYESCVPELGTLLAALRSCPVQSFAYLSSVELGYDGALTPQQADLAAGELYCQAHRSHFELPLLVARLGYLYAPVRPEEMGITGALLRRIEQGAPLRCPCAPEDCVDILHAEDAAAALYSLLTLRATGSYPVVSGHPLALERYFHCLGQAAGRQPEIAWQKERHTMPAEGFDARPLQLATGWIPLHLLTEEGENVLRQALALPPPEEPPTPAHAARRRGGRLPLRALGETLLLFAGCCLLLRFGKDVSDLKYVDIRLLFVALTACCYGGEMGALAVVLASGSYLYSLAASYVDTAYLLYSVDTWLPFVVYAVTGAVLGYIVNRRREDTDALRRRYDLLQEKYALVETLQSETQELKSRLQQQLLNARHSFGDLYRIVLELDALQPERLLQRAIAVVEEILEGGAAAVYFVDAGSGYARLMTSSPALKDSAPASLPPAKMERLGKTFRRGGLFVNTDLLPDAPDLAAPLWYDGRLYAFVAAYGIPPEKFTTYYQDLFRVVVSLLERNLLRALRYEQARRAQRCVADTALLRPQAFAEKLALLRDGADRAVCRFTLGRVQPPAGLDAAGVGRTLGALIRKTDYMGQDETGAYAVILTNTRPEQAKALAERLARAGFGWEVLSS